MSGSVFLVSFRYANKQLFNIKSPIKFLNHGISVSEIYSFVTVLRIEILLFIKQCQLKVMPGNK